MTDQLLGILNAALLAVLYLFFARVLWAVSSEVRNTRQRGDAPNPPADGTPHAAMAPHAVPPVAPLPTDGDRRGGRAATKPPKVPRGKRGEVGRLAVIEPRARRGAAYPLASELVIGRAPGCAISISDDSFVSQLHARVFRAGDRVMVEDLGSTNGTFVNTRRLTGTPVPLSHGDRVQVGSTVLEAQ